MLPSPSRAVCQPMIELVAGHRLELATAGGAAARAASCLAAACRAATSLDGSTRLAVLVVVEPIAVAWAANAAGHVLRVTHPIAACLWLGALAELIQPYPKPYPRGAGCLDVASTQAVHRRATPLESWVLEKLVLGRFRWHDAQDASSSVGTPGWPPRRRPFPASLCLVGFSSLCSVSVSVCGPRPRSSSRSAVVKLPCSRSEMNVPGDAPMLTSRTPLGSTSACRDFLGEARLSSSRVQNSPFASASARRFTRCVRFTSHTFRIASSDGSSSSFPRLCDSMCSVSMLTGRRSRAL
eukprot:scaffold20605_cov69-Phaeocystis_antarctica.AAC.3